MCGIIGLFDNRLKAGKGLEIMKNRGMDGSKSIKVDKGEIGHCLHSVVGNVLQPIKNKGVLSSNCEIYNWKKLSEKYLIKARNDSELLLLLIEKIGIKKTIKELDGDYAFIYYCNGTVFAARDSAGVKPVWYSLSKGLGIASEKTALEAYGFENIRELIPRQILKYKNSKAEFYYRPVKQGKALQKSFEQITMDLKKITEKSVQKRIPETKFGVLFSGGIDSIIIAKIVKSTGKDFTCYTAGEKNSRDVVRAKSLAKKYGFKIRVKEVSEHEIKNSIGIVTSLTQDTNVTKTSVGLVTHFATMLAREDGIKVLLSGVGADELFGGYARHAKSSDINHDCYSDFLKIFEKNTYRDDVISMNNSVELRFPFLDKKIVEYSLRIPGKFKIENGLNKYALRKSAQLIGIKEFDEKKVAAQYGSGIDRTIEKLSRKRKSLYLKGFYSKPNMKLAALFSGGKDSTYAVHEISRQNYEVSCLISIKSENKDSYMFHTPNIDITELQSEALRIPVISFKTKGEKEKELNDLKKAIQKSVDKYEIQGIVTGALYSNYQRSRIEKLCDELGLKVFSPLWHTDQYEYFKRLVKEGYKVILTKVAAEGLDKSWLGKIISSEDVEKLKKLESKYGLNVAGEGGEFESLVIDAPMFKKRIVIRESEIIGNDLIIKNAVLE